MKGVFQTTLWLLVGLGIVSIYSSSAIYAGRLYNDPQRFLKAQCLWVLFGLVAYALGKSIPRHFLRQRSGWFYLLAVVLCTAVLLPQLGHSAGGARRWLSLLGLSIQVSELAKLAVILSLSALFSEQQRQSTAQASLNRWRFSLWLPIVLVQLLVGLVLCEPDLGTALVLEGELLCYLFVAGLPLRIFLGFAGMLLPVVAYLVIATPFRWQRLLGFINPWAYRTTVGYQVTEALISLGSGGIWGMGLGSGKQKLFFLPEAHTDFILASIGEDLGFIGIAAVLLAYATLVFIALYWARRANVMFDKWLALGLATWIGVPVVLNTWVVTGLLPTKGLPLPLLSYGGSHLVMTLFALGLLFRIGAEQEV